MLHPFPKFVHLTGRRILLILFTPSMEMVLLFMGFGDLAKNPFQFELIILEILEVTSGGVCTTNRWGGGGRWDV
jgi:hypothetical protein